MANLEADYYSVVGVSHTADSNEIRTAYRKASLKVHPDRNPDDPKAAEKFHALKTAFEFLLDPIKRAEFDGKRAAQLARAARFAGLDNKRKAMARDLEAREEAYHKKQQADSSKNLTKARKLAEVQEAGARMRLAREAQLATQFTPAADIEQSSPMAHPKTHDPKSDGERITDCTLRFKWTRKKISEINDSETLADRIVSSGVVSRSAMDSIILSSKKASTSSAANPGELSKKQSALVCFTSLDLAKRFFDFAQNDQNWAQFSITRLNHNQ